MEKSSTMLCSKEEVRASMRSFSDKEGLGVTDGTIEEFIKLMCQNMPESLTTSNQGGRS